MMRTMKGWFSCKNTSCAIYKSKLGFPPVNWGRFLQSENVIEICVARRHLILYCNMGTTSVTKKGDLKGYGTLWYHPTGKLNILSLNNMKKKYRTIL